MRKNCNCGEYDIKKGRRDNYYLMGVIVVRNNLNKINWSYLSENSNAISILENNIDKINWIMLSKNKSIFIDEPMPLLSL